MPHRFSALYQPVLDRIAEYSAVTDRLIDKDVYRVHLATLWANIVTDPGDAGLTEDDLEAFHDFLGERIREVLGRDAALRDCFAFIASRPGEATMQRLHLPQHHIEYLQFFASMILDPEGHARWMDEIRRQQQPPR